MEIIKLKEQNRNCNRWTYGLGVGKSVMKNFLPQSSSDFIYAIIVEEYGLIGGIMVILIYLLILFRITVILHHASSVYGKLLIIGLVYQ